MAEKSIRISSAKFMTPAISTVIVYSVKYYNKFHRYFRHRLNAFIFFLSKFAKNAWNFNFLVTEKYRLTCVLSFEKRVYNTGE